LSADRWLQLVEAFLERRIDVDTFHDRFFELWQAARSEPLGPRYPEGVETLFYTVEAYCPDPTLRTPGSPFEADEAELRKDAELALARLKDSRQ
jgi:Bacterial self-protective colicin-like immunity